MLNNKELDLINNTYNAFKLGEVFLQIGIRVLKEEGYIIKEVSRRNEPYDLIVEKNNITYYVEVRGRKKKQESNTWNFNIASCKIYRLDKLDKTTLFLLINTNEYTIIDYDDLKRNKNKFSINNEPIIIGITDRDFKKDKYKNRKLVMLDNDVNDMLEYLKDKLKTDKKSIVNNLIKEYYSKIHNVQIL